MVNVIQASPSQPQGPPPIPSLPPSEPQSKQILPPTKSQKLNEVSHVQAVEASSNLQSQSASILPKSPNAVLPPSHTPLLPSSQQHVTIAPYNQSSHQRNFVPMATSRCGGVHEGCRIQICKTIIFNTPPLPISTISSASRYISSFFSLTP